MIDGIEIDRTELIVIYRELKDESEMVNKCFKYLRSISKGDKLMENVISDLMDISLQQEFITGAIERYLEKR